MRRQMLVALAVVALMAGSFVLFPSRAVRQMNRLVAAKKLYQLDDAEAKTLSSFLDVLRRTSGIAKPVQINKRYRRTHLNVYVTAAGATSDSPLRVGNSAFIAGADILIIDSAHFRIGDRKVLATPSDAADRAIVSAYRAYAYFVLAHEVGHRQLAARHAGPFRLVGRVDDPTQEEAADRFGVDALARVYEYAAAHAVPIVIAEPSISFTLDPQEPVARQLLADQLLLAINFISGEVLDNPFPILSRSASHPAFFKRMLTIITTLEGFPDVLQSEGARMSVARTRAIVDATQNLMRLNPAEADFDEPVDYAFIDNEHLYYFEFGDGKPKRVALEKLTPGSALRIRNAKRADEPSIRYAWMSTTGEIVVLGRDGFLTTMDARTGAVTTRTHLSADLGDNTCARRILIPPMPTQHVYVHYCKAGIDFVKDIDGRIARDGVPVARLIAPVLAASLRASGGRLAPDGIAVAQVSLGQRGWPAIYFAYGGAGYLLELTSALAPHRLHAIQAVADFGDAQRLGTTRVPFNAFVHVDGDTSLYFEGVDLFREMTLFRLRGTHQSSVGDVDGTPRFDEPRLRRRLLLREQRFVGSRYLVACIVQSSVYLVDLRTFAMLPISYHDYTGMEQVHANARGQWLLYQKYGRRILAFVK